MPALSRLRPASAPPPPRHVPPPIPHIRARGGDAAGTLRSVHLHRGIGWQEPAVAAALCALVRASRLEQLCLTYGSDPDVAADAAPRADALAHLLEAVRAGGTLRRLTLYGAPDCSTDARGFLTERHLYLLARVVAGSTLARLVLDLRLSTDSYHTLLRAAAERRGAAPIGLYVRPTRVTPVSVALLLAAPALIACVDSHVDWTKACVGAPAREWTECVMTVHAVPPLPHPPSLPPLPLPSSSLPPSLPPFYHARHTARPITPPTARPTPVIHRQPT